MKLAWLPIILCGMLAAMVSASLTAAETLYKWVDDQGRTHYSDSPPSETKSKPSAIHVAPSANQPASGRGRTWEEEESGFQQRQKAREADQVRDEKARDAARTAQTNTKQRCAEARARVGLLQSHEPVPMRNEKGEMDSWNYEQRGLELDRLGKFIDQNCPPE